MRRVLFSSALGAWLLLAWALWEMRQVAPEFGGVTLRRTLGTQLGQSENLEAFSPDGRVYATRDKSGLTLWDLNTGEKLGSISGYLAVVAFAPDGTTLATIDRRSRTASIFDVRTRKELAALPSEQVRHLVRDVPGISGLDPATIMCYWPDRNTLAIHSSFGIGGIEFWDVQTGELRNRLGIYSVLAFSPDGRSLALDPGSVFGTSSGLTLIADAGTGRTRSVLQTPAGANISEAAFSPDGKKVATVASWDGAVATWEAGTGRECDNFRPTKGYYYNDPIFSPDGNTLFLRYSHPDARAEALKKVISDKWANRLFAGASGVALLDVASGRGRALLPDCKTATFLNDGRTLITFDQSKNAIQFWDIPAVRPVRHTLASWAFALALAVCVSSSYFWFRIEKRGRQKDKAGRR
jgi:WD40 repeat protein